jgi:small-conductance mechanosensitive channel
LGLEIPHDHLMSNEKWINLRILKELLGLEPYLLLGLLALVTWGFYKLFLKHLSEERHQNLGNHYSNLTRHFIILSVLLGAYLIIKEVELELSQWTRILPYLALLTYIWGAVVFVKTCRTLVLQYLFMGSARSGVPLILVNIFTILLSILILFWSVSQIFNVQIGPLIATSAAFSIILGLALQDTLGNLFAGISLQVDRCYEIGDWLEIFNGSQKIVGQVYEITWRSTILHGLSDEVITLPNRMMAQVQLSNFSPPEKPVMRGQNFRIKIGSDIKIAINALEQAASQIFEIRGIPAPLAYVNEVGENWIQVRLIYYIDSFGSQFLIGDKILRFGLEGLEKNGIAMAKQRFEVEHYESESRIAPRPTHPS